MSTNASATRHIDDLPNELLAQIMRCKYNLDAADIDTLAGMSSIMPNQRPLTFGDSYQLRQINKHWNCVYLDNAAFWGVFPLFQMTAESLEKNLVHSKDLSLTVIVTNAESLGLFCSMLVRVPQRIQNVYISVPRCFWATIETFLTTINLPILRTLFMQVERGDDTPNFTGRPLPEVPYVLDRFPTITSLSIHDSMARLRPFVAPQNLTAIHLHPTKRSSTSFTLSLKELDKVLCRAISLEELDLRVTWLTEVDDALRFTSTTMRYLALSGTTKAAETLALYFSPCRLILFSVNAPDYWTSSYTMLGPTLLAITSTFTSVRTISSAGLAVCRNPESVGGWFKHVDLALRSDEGDIMTIRIHSDGLHTLPTLVPAAIAGSVRLAVDAIYGPDETLQQVEIADILRSAIPMSGLERIDWSADKGYNPIIIGRLATQTPST